MEWLLLLLLLLVETHQDEKGVRAVGIFHALSSMPFDLMVAQARREDVLSWPFLLEAGQRWHRLSESTRACPPTCDSWTPCLCR